MFYCGIDRDKKVDHIGAHLFRAVNSCGICSQQMNLKCDQVEVYIEITYPTDDVADAARPVAASLVQRPLRQGMSEV